MVTININAYVVTNCCRKHKSSQLKYEFDTVLHQGKASLLTGKYSPKYMLCIYGKGEQRAILFGIIKQITKSLEGLQYQPQILCPKYFCSIGLIQSFEQ
ncbi:unnamed protein product [Paramecium octaurelia]|uniref:Uncharacterized protein n=1 Tax=Paramecium octaurelia TaxID=43137 RepID=A0A8S1TYX9_PAROT|nr:unnamed protein product [Paramecium octaurelia]